MSIHSCQFLHFNSFVSSPSFQFHHFKSFISNPSCHFIDFKSFMSCHSCQVIHFISDHFFPTHHEFLKAMSLFRNYRPGAGIVTCRTLGARMALCLESCHLPGFHQNLPASGFWTKVLALVFLRPLRNFRWRDNVQWRDWPVLDINPVVQTLFSGKSI